MSTQEKLRNIGPKSAAWLRQVGLRSREDLAEVGAVDAFMRVKRAGFKPSLNLLYALEGALRDCHWQEVPEDRRTDAGVRGRRQDRAAAGATQSPGGRPGDDDPDGARRRQRIQPTASRCPPDNDTPIDPTDPLRIAAQSPRLRALRGDPRIVLSSMSQGLKREAGDAARAMRCAAIPALPPQR